jgi:hypothetical protein
MKYKVIFYDNSNTPENATFSFYTKSQAIAACVNWVSKSASYRAYLWDGTEWTQYYP